MIVLADVRHALGQLNAGIPERKIWDELLLAFNTPAANKVIVQQAQFAQDIGMGLRPLLMHLQGHLEFQKQMASEIAIALQGPAFTAKMIHWLPWVSLIGAQLIGVNALGYLITTVWGWLILVISAGLGLAAGHSTRRLLNRAARVVPDAGLEYRLMAAALNAGVGLPRALNVMAAIGIGGVDEVLAFCRLALRGSLNLADELTSNATELQLQLFETKRAELQILPIKMLTPVAGLLFPQFILLLVVPQVLATVSAYL